MESWRSAVTQSVRRQEQEVADGGCVSYVCLRLTLGLPLITAADFISNGPLSKQLGARVCVIIQ